jgi:hypothetical protein
MRDEKRRLSDSSLIPADPGGRERGLDPCHVVILSVALRQASSTPVLQGVMGLNNEIS